MFTFKKIKCRIDKQPGNPRINKQNVSLKNASLLFSEQTFEVETQTY